MIDFFAIVFSTVLVVYVVLRAYVANKTEVWFGTTPTEKTPADEKTRLRPPSAYRRS